MGDTLTKHELAAAIVHSALRTAGVQLGTAASDRLLVPSSVRLDEIVPRYEETGRARFMYGLSHAAKGLELRAVVPSDAVTLGEIVHTVAANLPVRLYQCQDAVEVHVYKEFGTGKCRIDDTDLVELKL